MCEDLHESKIIKNIESTIYEVVHKYQGGALALAKKLELKPGTFNNKCDPKMASHVLNIRELVKVTSETKDYRILFDLVHSYGFACLPIDYNLEGISDIDLLNAWAEWDVERGQTAQSIQDALTDGDISQKEILRIRKEMLDDIHKELELLKRLESIAIQDQNINKRS